jgi:energy-coupling factor transporter ATP-binding protein EcfA2
MPGQFFLKSIRLLFGSVAGPATMNDEFTDYIGTRDGWGGTLPFGIANADARQHVYVIGKTGSGKTTLLKNLIAQHIEAGHGVGLIDPHGDLAEELLDCVPPHRVNDLAYFNPSDLEFPVGINVLADVPRDERHLVASGIVEAFKGIWKDSWGPRLEYILYNAVAAVLDAGGATLLAVTRMLSDASFRKRIVSKVQDPLVRSFWIDEFERYDPRYMREAVAPVQNKVGQFLAGAPVRNVLGQVRSKIDFRFMIDSERIFIANLSKGKIGTESANLLGSLLSTQFQLAAMRRAEIPEQDRKDFFLYIDECHNFLTTSVADILSEARKHRLCLTLSHQYMDQLGDEVRKAVFGNAGSIISFRVGSHDAAILEREFGGAFIASQFSDLGNFEILVRLLVNGNSAEPFRATTYPPFARAYGNRDAILQNSRERFSMPRAAIEEKIRRWSERHSLNH